MKITLNDVEIDFSLESETTLGDVFTEIDQWLRENGHLINSIQVDQKVRDAHDTGWHTTPVEQVGTLAIAATSLREEQINDLETLHQFFDLLRRVLREGTDQQIKDVLDEYVYVRDSLPRLLPETADALDDALAQLDGDGKLAAGKLLETVLIVIQGRQRELLEPESESLTTATMLRESLSVLEEVPTLLQSGGDVQAMAAISRFTELVGKLLRILPLLMEIHADLQQARIEEQLLPDYLGSLNQVLNELVDAFSREDFVLLGDLVEYEIVPRVAALLDVLER